MATPVFIRTDNFWRFKELEIVGVRTVPASAFVWTPAKNGYMAEVPEDIYNYTAIIRYTHD